MIRGTNVSASKPSSFLSNDASDEELHLVASGAMRLPKESLDLDALLGMPKAAVKGRLATQAILDERGEER